MISLIKDELYKIVSKKIVIIGIIAVILMNLLLYINWAFPSHDAMSIHEDKEYSQQFDGKLTDEKIQQMHADYLLHPDYSFLDGNSTFDILRHRFETEEDNKPLLTIDEVFTDGYDEDVKDSLVWGYTEGCASIISVITSSLLIVGIVILIAISPIFAEDYTSGMDALILTSRYGKTKSIYAKYLAAVIFSLMLTLFSIAMLTVLFTINYGMQGWNASVQLSAMMVLDEVPYVLTFGQAFLIMCAVWIIAEIALATFICILSSVSRSPFISLLLSFIVYIGPFAASKFLFSINVPVEVLGVSNMLSIQPGLTLVESDHLYMIIIVADIVICAISFYLTKIIFSRHQVR